MVEKFTEQQRAAVFTKGNVLVSAAAGSGKTAVLVERVIALLTDEENSVSADKLLIVTFTNAAAAEMRTRIENRLDEECRKRPENIGLLRQRRLLSNAKICTIDSFCIDLVRENFDKVGISPDFKVGDTASLRAIDERVILEIINERIESGDGEFRTLLDIVGAEYDERNFSKKILEIYYYSRQLPNPKEWFKSLCEPFIKGEFQKGNLWFDYCFSNSLKTVNSLRKSLAALIDRITYSSALSDKFLPMLNTFSEQFYAFEEALKTNDWDTFKNLIDNFILPEKVAARGKGVSGTIEAQAVKLFYEDVIKALENFKKLFGKSELENKQQMAFLSAPIKVLSDILIEFDSRLFDEYLSQNTLTFHNTEHLALKLLTEFSEDFLDIYDEVMVDEYQDTNDLQDSLFYVLSQNEKRLFAVGDVKQSIYGFRGANPENFLNKKNRYIPLEKSTETDPKKIILCNNFRSNKAVCGFVNFFFENFMTKATAGIDYSGEERLISTTEYIECENSVEFRLLNLAESEEKALISEGYAIANYIKEVMNSPECIKDDDGTLRKARFSDFAILLRATKDRAPILAELLRGCSIPVNFSIEGFAERIEISTVLSLLKVIDNPRSDIELACVMLSPIFSFTNEQLAEIRSAYKNEDFYSAVAFSAKNGNKKVQDFLEKLNDFRRLSLTNTLPKLISRLIYESGYINIVTAMEDGTARRNNLLLLIKYATEYEASSANGLSSFVNFIYSQSENGLKCAVDSSGSDTVKIMSIHASKGLQFPVCIIANTSSLFKNDYNKEPIFYRRDSGIGFRYYEEKIACKDTTLGYEVIADINKRETLSEELRLLYVAMTRAKERLVFIGSISNVENKISSITARLMLSGGKVSEELFRMCSSYLDWLMCVAALHPNGKILRDAGGGLVAKDTDSTLNIRVIQATDCEKEKIENINEEYCVCDEICEKMVQNARFEYPFEKVRNIEAKASVSAVANKAESDKFAFSEKPSFLSGGATGSERGTAMHKVMQFIDFSKFDDINAEIERLYEWQFISENEAKSINIAAINKFFESDVFKRITKAEILHREMRFLTEFDAALLSDEIEKSDEKIIIQGAVDLCFVENGELIILDFKTDRVSEESELVSAYQEQLKFYALACEKIFGLPVKEKIIYSFALNKAIVI